MFQYDPTVSFWNFLAVGNYAARFYKFAMQDVMELQADLQQKANAAVTSLEDTILTSWFYPRRLTNNNQDTPVEEESAIQSIVVGLVTTLTVSQGDSTVLAWSQLLPKLITKYHDGYRAENLDQPSIAMKKLFYNKFWLDVTGYWNNKPNSGGDTIMFIPTPSSQSSASSMLILAFILATIAFLLGLRVGVQMKGSKAQADSSSSSSEGSSGGSFGFGSVQSAVLTHVPIDFKLFRQAGDAYSKPNRRDYISIEI